MPSKESFPLPDPGDDRGWLEWGLAWSRRALFGDVALTSPP